MKYHHFPVLTCFREVTWAELKIGDRVYYTIHRKRDEDRKAYGPWLVVDPAKGVLRNPHGVEIHALRWCITLMIFEELP